MTAYPLTRALGLKLHPYFAGVVPAADLEKILSEAEQVYSSTISAWTKHQFSYSEHQARLIMIEPIKPKDTAESLLREIFERDRRQRFIYDADWEIRAKRFLEEQGKLWV